MSEIRTIEQRQGIEAAETALIALLKEEPRFYQGFVALARVLLRQKKFPEAARAAQKAKTLAPLEAEPLVTEGIVHLRGKEHALAAKAFADAIRLDPDSARAHLGAAAVKMAEESYDDALKLCERVLDLDPSLERAHELVARISMRQGNTEGAIAQLRSLIDKNPGNRRVLRAYVRLMASQGRSEEVIASLTAAADDNPDDRRSANRLARVAIRTGRPEIAVERFKPLVESGSARLREKIAYATALIANGDLGEAENVVSSIEGRTFLVPIVHKLRGDILLKSGDPDAAIGKYKAACKSAKIPLLPVETAEAPAAPEEAAKAWKAHTRKHVLDTVRDRLANRS